jgi:hypothetical protein
MLTAIANVFIDTIQDSKKQFVSSVVPSDQLVQILEGFVDAQTAYTKAAVAASINTTVKIAEFTWSNNYFGDK